jgi:hypothetical protein
LGWAGVVAGIAVMTTRSASRADEAREARLIGDPP